MPENPFSPHSTVLSTPSPSEGLVSHKGRGSSEATPSEVTEATATSSKTRDVQRCLATAWRIAQDLPEQERENVTGSVINVLAGLMSSDEFRFNVSRSVRRFELRASALNVLRNQLPALHKEIETSANLANQNLTEYVKENIHMLLNLSDTVDTWEYFQQPQQPETYCGVRKRRASTSVVEHGSVSGTEQPAALTPKRPAVDLGSEMARILTYGKLCIPPRENRTSNAEDLREVENQRALSSPTNGVVPQTSPLQSNCSNQRFAATEKNVQADEEWTNIHTMLNCILSMVEKTRKALSILQQRCAVNENSDLQGLWLRRNSNNRDYNYEASQLRRQAGELIAHTLRATEDRVSEVKRKAEEAVHDVKRAAMAELQRALSAERARAERLIAEARRQGAEEAMLAFRRQGPPKELCWNCGRRASETCSGCNTARYCGTFCQHKHWEVHHKICGKTQTATSSSILDISDKSDIISGGSANSKNSKSPLPLQSTPYATD